MTSTKPTLSTFLTYRQSLLWPDAPVRPFYMTDRRPAATPQFHLTSPVAFATIEQGPKKHADNRE